MRKVLALIFTLISLKLFAQEYRVESFDIAPRDITARTESRVDNNGRKCAVIKVYVDDNIAAVRGPVVGDVAGAGMEKWIYLCHDAKEMEIVFDHHIPLHVTFMDYDYPSVTGQMTYILKLVPETTAQTQPAQLNQSKPSSSMSPANSKEEKILVQLKEALKKEDYKKAMKLALQIPDNAEAQFQIGDMYSVGNGVEMDYDKAYEWEIKAALQGHAQAMEQIGCLYYGGYGVEQNIEEALHWFEKAAEKNFPKAFYNIGVLYETEPQLEGDINKAISWYEKGMELNNPESTNMLGIIYSEGKGGIPVNMDKAFEMFRKAAEEGYTAAMCNLANFYATKLRTPNYNEAIRWYKLAAEKGEPTAMTELGNFYYEGITGKNDYVEAFKWYHKGAEAGDYTSIFMTAICYDLGYGVKKDQSEAFKWYTKSADLGEPMAMHLISKYYNEGLGGLKKDPRLSFNWLLKAAEKGLASAFEGVGLKYYLGNGTAQDYNKAYEWFNKSIEAGSDELSLVYLGIMNETGKGVPGNYQEAFKYYKMAADKDIPEGMVFLGNLYENGNGVPIDKAEAIKLYKKAADKGDQNAIDKLKQLGIIYPPVEEYEDYFDPLYYYN